MTILDQSVFDAASDEVRVRAKKALYLRDPVAWAHDYLGIRLWSKQREILYSIRDNRKTAVAAGHGVGKSFVAAVAMAWWIDVHPLGADHTGAPQTFVASTAPFADQITAILWNNLRIIHALSASRHKEFLRRRAAGQPLEEYQFSDHALPGRITGDNMWKTDDGLLIGQGRKPPDNKTDSGYQGLHATYLLAIGDEAAGLGKDMVDALGNITTGKYNRMLLIANPTDPTSAMAKLWQNNVAGWNLMHISVFDSPQVTNEKDFPLENAPALSGWDYINEKKAEWGVDDPQYIARVLGQWAFDAGNNVFTEMELARAANCVVLPDPSGAPRHGWDIARSGKDATVGYRMLEGEVWATDHNGVPTHRTGRRGIQVRRIDSWTKAPLVGSDPENLGSAQRIDTIALGEGARVLVVDASGLGSGVVDGLRDLNLRKSYNVIEYFGSGRTSNKKAYTNARAQHYFELKTRMFAGELDLDPKDKLVLEELRGIVYEYDKKGAKKIEAKDDARKRGAKSPDNADAFLYASVDVSALTERVVADMEPGDVVLVDPADYISERYQRDSELYPV